jgi:hypothetical protein
VAEDMRMALHELLRKAELEGDVDSCAKACVR